MRQTAATAAAASPVNFVRHGPSQDAYLALLHDECRRRGLVGWKETLTDDDILAAFPLDAYVYSDQRYHHTQLTKDQWADPTDAANDIEFRKIAWEKKEQALEEAYEEEDDDDDDDEERTDPAVGRAKEAQQDEWKAQKRAVLKTYAPLYLQNIVENTKRDYLAAGGTQGQLDQVENDHPANTVLYLLAELWKLQQQQQQQQQQRPDRGKDSEKEQFLAIRVFCDIRQESCHPVDCKIRYKESWSGFVSKMNQQLLVRYLVTKHHPAIADTLFVDDDTVWPPEGVLPLRNYDDSIVFPEHYTKRADIVYENGPGRGWWALVHPKEDAQGLINIDTQWKAIDNASDWDSLMKWLDEHRTDTVAFRHQSTKERMEFVAKKRAEEETVLGFPGYVPFNIYLDRHWDMVQDKKQICELLRPEPSARAEREGEVPEASEQLQSAAVREINAILHECRIEEDEEDN